jgi:hypothetical protein
MLDIRQQQLEGLKMVRRFPGSIWEAAFNVYISIFRASFLFFLAFDVFLDG